MKSILSRLLSTVLIMLGTISLQAQYYSSGYHQTYYQGYSAGYVAPAVYHAPYVAPYTYTSPTYTAPAYKSNTYSSPSYSSPSYTSPSYSDKSYNSSHSSSSDQAPVYIKPVPVSGFGSYTYADGSTYSGNFKNSQRSGTGTLIKAEEKYEGEWANDVYNGKGTLTYGNRKYVGDFVDGRRSGQGKYISYTGDIYEGQWKDNKEQGYGIFTMVNGDKYEGEFADNEMNGKGTYTWKAGAKYVGEWRKDVKEGSGKLYDPSGKITKEGNWKADRFIDAASSQMADLRKILGSATHRFDDAKGDLISTQKYKRTSIKTFKSLLSIGGGSESGRVHEFTLTDYDGWIEFSQSLSFASEADRDEFMEELEVLLALEPHRGSEIGAYAYLKAYPHSSINFSNYDKDWLWIKVKWEEKGSYEDQSGGLILGY